MTQDGRPDSPQRPQMAGREPQRPDAGIRWVRGDHQVAARIAPSDLEGRLRSGLEIQPGTRALLFVGGRYVGTLPPGRHTLESVRDRLRIPTQGEPTAIVVDDGELGLELEVDGFHSADDRSASVFAQLALRMAEPEVFLANLMKDSVLMTVADLGGHLAEEIRQALRELVKQHRAEELHRGRVRAAVEMELLSRWRASLERTGFVLNRFRVLRFVLPGLEAAEDLRSEAGDASTVAEAERAAKEAYVEAELADFTLGTDILDRRETAAEERREVEIEHERRQTEQEATRLERRYEVLKRLLDGGNLERMTTLESEEEWRKFRREVDKDQLLDEAEWTRLQRDTAAQAEQDELKRHFLFQRLHAMAEAELEELKLQRAYQLKLVEVRGDSEVAREVIEREREQLEGELANRRATFANEMEERERWFQQELHEHRSTAEMQLWRLERVKAIEQMTEDREHARQLELEVTRADIERKRLAQEGELISVMSPDQIHAWATKNAPDKAGEIAKVAEAMRAGEATARERELYERILAEVKEARDRTQALDHEKFVERVQADARLRADREALDEREKDRAERIATAGLTKSADVVHRYEGTPGGAQQWIWCERHQIKHRADRPCPLCAGDDEV